MIRAAPSKPPPFSLQFLASLADVAAKKGVSLEDLKALLCEGQVQFNGATIPAAVKYHVSTRGCVEQGWVSVISLFDGLKQS